MKKIIICSLFAICAITSIAQNIQDIGKVMLGVKIADDATTDTKQVSMQLQSRLSQIATQAGYSSNGTSSFAIFPNIIVNYVDVAEGGMKPIYVVQGDLVLMIASGVDGTVFSSTTLPFKGSSTDKNKAILSGILKIGYPNVKNMFDEARSKILEYYVAKGKTIFAQADSYAFNQQYDEAIACLMLIPEELFDLHSKAMNKAIEIYDKRNTKIARQQAAQLASQNDAILKKAQGLLSMQNAEEALKVLWNYRNGSETQNAQYNDIVTIAGALVSEEKKRILAADRQRYLDARMREDREWSMHVQSVEHERSLENREMLMRENAAEHQLQMENKTFDHQAKMDDKEWKLREKTTDHQIRMDHRQMDYELEVIDTNAQTERQKIDAVKTVALDFFQRNPNFIKHLK